MQCDFPLVGMLPPLLSYAAGQGFRMVLQCFLRPVEVQMDCRWCHMHWCRVDIYCWRCRRRGERCQHPVYLSRKLVAPTCCFLFVTIKVGSDHGPFHPRPYLLKVIIHEIIVIINQYSLHPEVSCRFSQGTPSLLELHSVCHHLKE